MSSSNQTPMASTETTQISAPSPSIIPPSSSLAVPSGSFLSPPNTNDRDMDMDPDASLTPTRTPTPAPAPAASSSPAAAPIVSDPPPLPQPAPEEPSITLQFLLISGHRHSLSIPLSSTVLRTKELIWNNWPIEQEGWKELQPPSPGFLRLLCLGRMWMDGMRIEELNVQNNTVVHLSVRPFLTAENDAYTGSGKKRKAKRMSTVASEGNALDGDAVPDTDAAAHGGCCCIIC